MLIRYMCITKQLHVFTLMYKIYIILFTSDLPRKEAKRDTEFMQRSYWSCFVIVVSNPSDQSDEKAFWTMKVSYLCFEMLFRYLCIPKQLHVLTLMILLISDFHSPTRHQDVVLSLCRGPLSALYRHKTSQGRRSRDVLLHHQAHSQGHV